MCVSNFLFCCLCWSLCNINEHACFLLDMDMFLFVCPCWYSMLSWMHLNAMASGFVLCVAGPYMCSFLKCLCFVCHTQLVLIKNLIGCTSALCELSHFFLLALALQISGYVMGMRLFDSCGIEGWLSTSCLLLLVSTLCILCTRLTSGICDFGQYWSSMLNLHQSFSNWYHFGYHFVF